MYLIKLQLGCLLVIAYMEISYIWVALRNKIPCNRYFDALMVIAPWAVVFDGLTAWTVNHMDIVPDFWNRGAHLLFFIFMDLTVIITAEYFYSQLIRFRNKAKECLLLSIPGILSLLLIIVGIGELGYIQGKTTWYSMGFSVYICYGTLILYYGFILYLLVTRRGFLSPGKVVSILSFIVIVGVLLVIQMCYPEVLLTSILPTILLLGIYFDFENPSMRKVTMQNIEIINSFATMVESRDSETGSHIKRTRAYVDLMLDRMRHDRRYRAVLSRDYLENVSNAAPLHDIGKISTPDEILQKPGKLTDEEYEVMKRHAATGSEILQHSLRDFSNTQFRQIAYEVARYHHEKFNGRGYPDGLKGEQIPLHARVMAIADVFDAVSQRRCYRDALPVEECFSIIEKGSGTDFDPDIVRIFLDAKEEILERMHN